MLIPAPRARRVRSTVALAPLMGLAAGLAASPFAGVSGAWAADEVRRLDAHVHGVGLLQIAFDGAEIALRLEAPAADLVGFERAPRTDEERAAVDAAIASLEDPLSLFALPEAAGCAVGAADAVLVLDDDHDGHDDHGDDDHAGHGHGDDDDHAEHAHGDDDHAEHAHGDDDHAEHAHGDDDHAEHAHDDHDHDEDHAAQHAEFQADALLTCTAPEAADLIEVRYFDRFPNAERLDATVIGPAGAQSLEATPDAPTFSLRGVL